MLDLSDVLTLERITVKKDRVVCDIKITAKDKRYTNPELIKTVLQQYPHLANHTCKNKKGTSFAAVMEQTSLPHLLEHMVIEAQVFSDSHAEKQSDTLFVGTSAWLDEKEGTARVEVSFMDDIQALRAFREASQILNNAL